MKTESKNLKRIPFNVHIPNLDGDGIAQTIPIEVEAYTDPKSGEDILTPESLDLIEKTQARHMGLMNADEIKKLRLALGLSQEEMSELLQIGGKSYTRWESGRARPSRSMNVVLCALRDGQLDVNYLQALRDPEREKEWSSRNVYSQMLTYWMSHCSKQKTSFTPVTKVVHPETMSVWKQQMKAYLVETEDEEGSLAAPTRLPSSAQQRETFIKARLNLDQIEITSAG